MFLDRYIPMIDNLAVTRDQVGAMMVETEPPNDWFSRAQIGFRAGIAQAA